MHLVSLDGLLLDFQAGGEFVLIRATDPLAGSTYTITYPSGEVLTAARQLEHGQARAHFNVAVSLPSSRKGAVEGLLGNANGQTKDDILLPGGDSLVQPVSFAQLHEGADSFANAWRVSAEASLFHYTGDDTHETFRAYPYDEMPASLPPAVMPYAQQAQAACAGCPDNLKGTCMTDVGYTNDLSLAAACLQAPGVPSAEMPLQGPHAVYPLPDSQMECGRKELVFRARNAAEAHTKPELGGFKIEVRFWGSNPWSWHWLESFNSSNVPIGGWGDRFTCKSIGVGWGECTVRFNEDLCAPRSSNVYRWSLRTTDDVSLFTRQFLANY